MTESMNHPSLLPWLRRSAAVLGLLLASGCGGLLSKGVPPPSIYSLDGVAKVPLLARPLAAPANLPTLVVNPTRAAPGFDSPHIVYVRVAHQLEHFAHSQWADTPARMLEPRIVAAIDTAGAFRAVALAASGSAGDLRLDTEVLRLQQEFGGGPSRVRFTLRATLLDNSTRQVISWREFEETASADSEDSYGGVVAANRVVQVVMEQLSRYCAQAAERWQAANPVDPNPRKQNQ
jgi:cholesterol transport system auxiliary component